VAELLLLLTSLSAYGMLRKNSYSLKWRKIYLYIRVFHLLLNFFQLASSIMSAKDTGKNWTVIGPIIGIIIEIYFVYFLLMFSRMAQEDVLKNPMPFGYKEVQMPSLKALENNPYNQPPPNFGTGKVSLKGPQQQQAEFGSYPMKQQIQEQYINQQAAPN